LRDENTFFLGQRSVDVEHEWVSVGPQLGNDEGDTLRHQAGDKGNIPTQTIELGDHDRASKLTGLGQGTHEFRPAL
jgi:hypothetical protein